MFVAQEQSMHSLEPRKLLEILAVLDRLHTPSEVLNRRVFKRYPVRAQGTLTLDPQWQRGGAPLSLTAHVRDVSRGGLGLLCRGSVELGRPMRFVCSGDGFELFGVTVVPRREEELLHGVRLVGCAFAAEAALLLSIGVRQHELSLAESPASAGDVAGDFASIDAL